MKRVLAYVPDLMDRSRITAAGAEVTFAGSPSALVAAAGEVAAAETAGGGDRAAGDRPDVVVVVDLGRPGVLAAIGQIGQMGLPVIGFASHVDRELLAAARAAGCATVLARSAFFSRVGALLSDPPPVT
jgi:hypothetical protein